MRLRPGDDVAANREDLRSEVSSMLAGMTRTLTQMPGCALLHRPCIVLSVALAHAECGCCRVSHAAWCREIAVLCRRLQEVVTTRFPEARHSSLGGIIFLRWICPALLSPHSFGLRDGVFACHSLFCV